MPSQALNSRRARRGPSGFAPASDSRLWSQRVKNRGLGADPGARTVAVASHERRNRGSRTCHRLDNLSDCDPGAHSLSLLVFEIQTGALTGPRTRLGVRSAHPHECHYRWPGMPKGMIHKYPSSAISVPIPTPCVLPSDRFTSEPLWVILWNRWMAHLHASVLHVLNTYLTDGCRASWETGGLKNNAPEDTSWGQGESPPGFWCEGTGAN